MNPFQSSSTREPVIWDTLNVDYHKSTKQRGDPTKIMSRSELMLFAKNPLSYIQGAKVEPTAAMDWGSLIDCLVTSPQSFASRYVVCPDKYPAKGKKDAPPEMKDWNWSASYCDEFRATAKAEGKECVKADVYERSREAVARLHADKRVMELISCSQFQVQVNVDYHDHATGLVIPFTSLLDMVPRDGSRYADCIADLKTGFDARPKPWRRTVFNMNLHAQAAVYLDAWNAATGQNRQTFRHVLQESESPYPIARRMLSVEFLNAGTATYRNAMRLYCDCLVSGDYPGFDDMPGDIMDGDLIDGWRATEPELWMGFSTND